MNYATQYTSDANYRNDFGGFGNKNFSILYTHIIFPAIWAQYKFCCLIVKKLYLIFCFYIYLILKNNISFISELPETSFTRSISNPEAVMRRRRQQKLERKLQQFRSKDGGPDTGMSIKKTSGRKALCFAYILLFLFTLSFNGKLQFPAEFPTAMCNWLI